MKGTFFDGNASREQIIMQIIYNVCIFTTIIILALSYKYEKLAIFKKLAFGLIVIRNSIRLIDFENSLT